MPAINDVIGSMPESPMIAFPVRLTFQLQKDEEPLTTVSFIPMWHWTDQKIRVHAFCCVISLLLLNLLQREVLKKYQKMSLERIIEELSDIEKLLLFYPDIMKSVRKLSKRDDIQDKFYQILNLGEFAPEEIG